MNRSNTMHTVPDQKIDGTPKLGSPVVSASATTPKLTRSLPGKAHRSRFS